MTAVYRPGQLYAGREDDLLFCVAGQHGIGFVTNRGTWVPLDEAERVYVPLRLVCDVDEAERLRAQLAAFVPPGALSAGEIPALCRTCKERLCVPGLPGCARCVKAELKRLFDAGDRDRASAHGLGRDYRQAVAERSAARTEAARLRLAWQSARRGRRSARALNRELVASMEMLRGERDEAREQVTRVRALHYEVCGGACGLDDACECEDRDLVCTECNDRWPCPTIRTLDSATREAGGPDA